MFLNYLRVQWDRAGAWVCVAAGFVALALGWVGVSDTTETSDQIPYLVSGGLLGLYLLIVGAMLWLSADTRDEWRKLDAIEQVQRQLVSAMAEQASGRSSSENGIVDMTVPEHVARRQDSPVSGVVPGR